MAFFLHATAQLSKFEYLSFRRPGRSLEIQEASWIGRNEIVRVTFRESIDSNIFSPSLRRLGVVLGVVLTILSLSVDINTLMSYRECCLGAIRFKQFQSSLKTQFVSTGQYKVGDDATLQCGDND